MENPQAKDTQQDVESQDKATASKWRSDERRSNNRILSILLRNAERKHKAKLSKKPSEDDLKA